MSKKSIERANITLNEVTQQQPGIFYARCINAAARPTNHTGDWPVEGIIYPVHLVLSKMEGIPLIHVLGFEGEAPFYNAFSPDRFQLALCHMFTLNTLGFMSPIHFN